MSYQTKECMNCGGLPGGDASGAGDICTCGKYAPYGIDAMRNGTALIAVERRRQIEREGYSSTHDSQHARGEIAHAAAAYAVHASKQVQSGGPFDDGAPPIWPWENADWKPSDYPVRNLVKAGALIAAEIDRLLSDPAA